MRAALLLAAVVAAFHLPAVFTAGFAYDDGPAILDHPDLRSIDRVPRVLLTEYWGADRANQMYRPLQQASYAVEGVLTGFDPRATHAAQLAWHLAAVIAGWSLLGALGLAAGPRWFAAAAFGVHPSLMDASVWISGRCDVQALLFVALGLRRFARMDDGDGAAFRRRDAAAGLFLLLGALSKEVALALPGAALLLFGRRALRAWPWIVGALVVYGALRFLSVPGYLPGIPNEAGVVLQDRAWWERVAIGCRGQLLLVLRLLNPAWSVADHRGHPAALPATVVGFSGFLSVVVFFVVGAAATWARGPSIAARVARLAGVAAAFFVPVLQIWPIGAVMPERFLYVPAFFLVAAVAVLVAPIAETRPRAFHLAATAVVLLLGFRLVARTDVYRDDGTYFSDVLRAYPRDERAWNNLGVFRMLDAKPPDFDGADAAFAEALAIRPGYRRGRLNAARSAIERRRVTRDGSRLALAEGFLAPGLKAGDKDARTLLGRIELFQAEDAADPDLRRIAFERAEAAFVSAGAWREAAFAAEKQGAAARAAEHRARMR